MCDFLALQKQYYNIIVTARPELPPICPDGAHEWVKSTVAYCGWDVSDQVLDEAIVFSNPTRDGPGVVCNRCFVPWEKRQTGKRDPALSSIYLNHLAWDNYPA